METNILHTHKELVEKSKLGDRVSQYKLYELYVDAMYNVSMRMMKIKEDAEDVVQDSFMKHLIIWPHLGMKAHLVHGSNVL